MTNPPICEGIHPVPPGKLAVVVTYLEMTAPPDLPTVGAVPPVASLEFARVATPDPDWYRDLFRRVGGVSCLWSSRLRLAPDVLAGILHDPDIHVISANKDGQAEGLLELNFRESGTCELAFFGVTEALIGTGAGTALMHYALRQAWAAPITRLHLQTCTADHPNALAFYRRFGFRPFRQAIEIMPDPRLDGTLPRDAAPHIPLY